MREKAANDQRSWMTVAQEHLRIIWSALLDDCVYVDESGSVPELAVMIITQRWVAKWSAAP